MGFHLDTPDGRSMRVNAWNWGTLHHLVDAARLFPVEVWEPMRYNAGCSLEPVQVRALAEFLKEKIQPALEGKVRLTMDGTATDVPDDGTFYRAEDELEKNYSLDAGVLASIIAFLEAAGATDSPVSVG